MVGFGVGGGERGDEVGNNGSLGGSKAAVPDEIDRDFAGEERPSVVLEEGG